MIIKCVYEHYRVFPLRIEGFPVLSSKRGRPPIDRLHRYNHEARELSRERESPPYERGGKTVCKVFDAESKELLATGEAVCSMSDPFCYRIGREIAQGRAMKGLIDQFGYVAEILEVRNTEEE